MLESKYARPRCVCQTSIKASPAASASASQGTQSSVQCVRQSESTVGRSAQHAHVTVSMHMPHRCPLLSWLERALSAPSRLLGFHSTLQPLMCVSLQRSAAVGHLCPNERSRDRTGSRHQQAVGVPSILKKPQFSACELPCKQVPQAHKDGPFEYP